ncbi:MAG: hypothetical protein CL421_06875 [Acidimicrobiaceae bacterium]|nr:hypothetical protein [Acidimicrobiaceae bacterium]|tara:strand:- start:522 stop:1790 length:1269 start_codon:yes stop_codon:yes gene_type:complete
MTFNHLQTIIQQVDEVRRTFESAGKKIYLVGGIVRDLYGNATNIQNLDIDLTTNATPAEIKAIIKPIADNLWLSGEKFGTIGAHVNGKTIEITTHRSESYLSDSRKPIVEFSQQIEEDLSRRDFTVNSMAIDLSSKELIDPFNGQKDFADGVLRTPLNPDISFSEDPLRMLRAARFTCRFELTPTKKMVQSMKALAPRLEIVSPERIREEFDKFLEVRNPEPGFKLLLKTKIYKLFLPEINDKENIRKNGGYKSLSQLPIDPLVRLAALLLNTSAKECEYRMKKLKYSNERISQTQLLIQSTKTIETKPIDNESYRKWYFQTADLRDTAIELAKINKKLKKIISEMERTKISLEHELHDFSVPLTGAEIMELLKIQEGPEVGEAVQYLQEIRFQKGPITQGEAEKAIRNWWDEKKTVPKTNS